MNKESLKFDMGFGGVDLDSVKKAWSNDEAKIQDQINAISKLNISVKGVTLDSLTKNIDSAKKALDELEAQQIKLSRKTITPYQAGKLSIQRDNAELTAQNKILNERAIAQQRVATEEKRTERENARYRESLVKTNLAEAKLTEVLRRKEIAMRKAEQAQSSSTKASNKAKVSIDSTTDAWKAQKGVLNGLPQFINAYISVLGATRLTEKIREVTAEFELQRVALGAIIRDKAKADKLFSETVQLATQSPFQVGQLITYVKELSAYRIETENLFNTTKRLADVSAGLGVDMSRLVLAYGQVKAASVLRGQELRQFTEAGIPMVQLLADKFSQLRGEVVSTGDVFQLISDRAVSFRMVEEIFQDMTNAGGMFYDMQRKQAETLAGSWSNLQDEISLAMNSMGEEYYEVLRGYTEAMKNLIREWETWVPIVIAAGGAVGTYALISATATKAELARAAAKRAIATMELAEIKRAPLMIRWMLSKNMQMSIAIALDNARAFSLKKLAASTSLASAAFWKLSAAILNNPWAIAAAAVIALTVYLTTAKSEAQKLADTLGRAHSGIKNDVGVLVTRFKILTTELQSATKGSKEYRDIMTQLTNEYSQYLPKQLLDADNLTILAEKTDLLTEAIRRKKRAQAIEAGQTAIDEKLGAKTQDAEAKLRQSLESIYDPVVAAAIVSKYMSAMRDALETGSGELPSLRTIITDYLGAEADMNKITSTLTYKANQARMAVIKEYQASAQNIVLANSAWSAAATKLDQDLINAKIKSLEVIDKMEKEALEQNKKNKYDSQLEEEESILNIKKEFAKKRAELASKEIASAQEALIRAKEEGAEQTEIDALEANLTKVKTLYGVMAEEAAFAYDKLIPDQLNTQITKAIKQIAELSGESTDAFSQLFKGADEDLKAYSGRLHSLASTLKTDIDTLGKAEFKLGSEDNADRIKTYNTLLSGTLQLIKMIGTADGESAEKEKAKRTQELKAEISVIKEAYAKYQQLEKQIGSDKARSKIQELYEDIAKDFSKLPKGNLVFSDEEFASVLKQALKVGQSYLSQADSLKINVDISDAELKTFTNKVKKTLKDLQTEFDQQQKANKFFESMLGLTGNRELSASLTVSVYGGGFEDVAKNTKAQLIAAFEQVDISMEVGGDSIDYTGLLSKINQLPIDAQDSARKMVEAGIASNAEYIKGLFESLSDFASFNDKKLTIARQTQEAITKINASELLSEMDKNKLIKAARAKMQKELGSEEWGEFKESNMYIDMFKNLETTSTVLLNRMKSELESLSNQVGITLDPNDMRELVERMQDIDSELAARNPFKSLYESLSKYRDEVKKESTRSLELKLVSGLDKEAVQKKTIKERDDEIIHAESMLAVAEKKYGVSSMEAQVERDNLGVLIQDRENQLEILSLIQKQNDEYQESLKRRSKLLGISAEDAYIIQNQLSSVSQSINKVTELMGNIGASDDFMTYAEEIGVFVGGIGDIAGGVGDILLMKDPIGGIARVIGGLADSIGSVFNMSYVRRVAAANTEIERQSEILSRLDKEYAKLQKNESKVLGSDYIQNEYEKIAIMEAQLEAEKKRLDAEKSKGKKSDKETIAQMTESYKDAEEALIEAQQEVARKISETMLETDSTSLEKNMAKSWIDAYIEIGRQGAITTGDMKKQWKDAMKNMVANSLIARSIQSKLEPVFKMVDDLFKDGKTPTTDEINKVIQSGLQGIDELAEALPKILDGLDLSSLKDTASNLQGVSKSIAQASEEQIVGAAVAFNAVAYEMGKMGVYVYNILNIAEQNRKQMEGVGTNIQSLLFIQQESLSMLRSIETNTRNTASGIRSIDAKLDEVIGKAGSPKSKSITVTIR